GLGAAGRVRQRDRADPLDLSLGGRGRGGDGAPPPAEGAGRRRARARGARQGAPLLRRPRGARAAGARGRRWLSRVARRRDPSGPGRLLMLDGFETFPFTHDGTTRTVFRRGRGPGIVIMHEIPGITPEVAAFGRRVADAGFTVYMP